MVSIYQMQSFRSFLVDPSNGLDVKNERGITTQTLLQQIQENAICMGQNNFFKIDYTFISQVSIAAKLWKINTS